jgi:prolipoprotein diacylglyceryltransferase
LPVHPTELYSSANGAVLCLILYLFWKRAQKAIKSAKPGKLFTKPGCTFGLMFILYGTTRFFIEFIRDDNPFEYGWWAIYKGATVSQNISIYMIIFGLILMLMFQRMKTQQTK